MEFPRHEIRKDTRKQKTYQSEYHPESGEKQKRRVHHDESTNIPASRSNPERNSTVLGDWGKGMRGIIIGKGQKGKTRPCNSSNATMQPSRSIGESDRLSPIFQMPTTRDINERRANTVHENHYASDEESERENRMTNVRTCRTNEKWKERSFVEDV